MLPGLAAGAFAQGQPGAVNLEPPREVRIPPRVGIAGEARIGLGETIERVLASDPDLRVARIAREEAGYNVRAALGAFDPVVGLQAYRVKQVTPVASVLGGTADGKLTQAQQTLTPRLSGAFPALGGTYSLSFTNSRQTTDNSFNTLNPQYPTELSLSLNQPLWRGLRFDENRHRIGVARQNENLTRQQLRQRVTEVVTQAIQGYWELAYAWQNMAVQSEAVRLAERQYQSNQRQAREGILAPIDVVAAQTQVATFQQGVLLAQQALTQAENNLKTMMLPNRGDLLWGAALVPETEVNTDAKVPPLEEAVQQARAARPELAESDTLIAVNMLDTRLSRENTRPRVDAFANLTTSGLAGATLPSATNGLTSGFIPLINLLNELAALNNLPGVGSELFGNSSVPPMFVGGYGQSLSNVFSGRFPSVQVGVNVSLPIRNRTAEAQAAVSVAEGRRLHALQDQIGMAVEADVRNALQAAVSARSRLDAAQVASRSAEEQYLSEQRQFQAGTSTVFLVLQRQTDMITARSREVRARADVAEALANLDRATARTIEARGIRLAP
jgi:outer membrane protein TolC